MRTTDLFGKKLKSGQRSVLGKRFRFPPFSVWNARDGDWQDRKRAWIALGIKSELGRGEGVTWNVDDPDEYRHQEGTRRAKAQSYRMDQYIDEYRPNSKGANAAPGGSPMPAMDYSNKERGDGRGRPIGKVGPGPGGLAYGTLRPPNASEKTQGMKRHHAQPGGGPSKKSVWLANGKPVGGSGAINAIDDSEYDPENGQTGTSIFDPVICELFYRWFTPEHGLILDPFAGGSVRGVVAAVTGRDYVGIDLRPEQIKANEKQARTICREDEHPVWLQGDSRNIQEIVHSQISPKFKADAVFSCPPYFNLELYSDDTRDLSNTTWREFCESYAEIIKQSVDLLKDDRFACFVVGDIRNKRGYYRNFPSLTIDCFEEAGARLYNEAVLITAVGSLPLRIHAQFSRSRKIGKSHQNVLIFVKGDPKKATEACEPLENLQNDIAFLKEISDQENTLDV